LRGITCRSFQRSRPSANARRAREPDSGRSSSPRSRGAKSIRHGARCATVKGRWSPPTEAALHLEQHIDRAARQEGQPDQREAEQQRVAVHGSSVLLTERGSCFARRGPVALDPDHGRSQPGWPSFCAAGRDSCKPCESRRPGHRLRSRTSDWVWLRRHSCGSLAGGRCRHCR
jgi:hypothetical protein